MNEKIHLTARIPKTLHDDLLNFMESESCSDKTAALCELIRLGLKAQKDSERMRNLFEQISLKTFHYLRSIAATRGDDFVTEVDSEFELKKSDMAQMLLEFGVSYQD